jgi:hypothetical protein
MKFTSFDKKNLNSLRAEMSEVLKKYGVESNLQVEIGNMKFSSAEVEIKVTAKVNGLKTQEDELLEIQAKILGLKMTNKAGDSLVGYKAANWKMPYIYAAADGKKYKCDERKVKMLFSTY